MLKQPRRMFYAFEGFRGRRQVAFPLTFFVYSIYLHEWLYCLASRLTADYMVELLCSYKIGFGILSLFSF
jgi:hypothetical protein